MKCPYFSHISISTREVVSGTVYDVEISHPKTSERIASESLQVESVMTILKELGWKQPHIKLWVQHLTAEALGGNKQMRTLASAIEQLGGVEPPIKDFKNEPE